MQSDAEKAIKEMTDKQTTGDDDTTDQQHI